MASKLLEPRLGVVERQEERDAHRGTKETTKREMEGKFMAAVAANSSPVLQDNATASITVVAVHEDLAITAMIDGKHNRAILALAASIRKWRDLLFIITEVKVELLLQNFQKYECTSS